MAFAPILRRASAAKNLFSLSRLSLGSSPSVRSLQTGASGDDRQPPPPLSPSSIAGYHVSSGGYMRGAVYREPNQPLTIEEFHIPRPKVNEILIKTKGRYYHHVLIRFEIIYEKKALIFLFFNLVCGQLVEYATLIYM